MREILFRGKCFYNGKWVKGFIAASRENMYPNGFEMITVDGINYNELDGCIPHFTSYAVDPSTIGQYTGLKDKNGKKIFEGDIVQYLTYSDFDCQSTVKFGVYKQDGSDGEYKASNCLGFYVELGNFTCPDWYDNEPEMFYDYLKQQSLAEISSQCEVIGNIHDNPELIRNEV